MAGGIQQELELVLTIDAAGYVSMSRRVKHAGREMVDTLDAVEKKAKLHRSVFNQVGGGYDAVSGPAKRMVGAFVALDVAMLAAGNMARTKASDFEALELALVAVEGSAESAKSAMKDLREIAKGPGLGVTEAIQTYSGLRRGGIERDLAMSLTRELGNAVARSGGGKEVLGRAGLALGQMATKPFLQGEELNQLTEAGIPAHKMIKDIFGSSDTEELKRKGITSQQVLVALAAALSKLERVAGGSKNASENLDDTLDQMTISIGRGINSVVTPSINEFNEAVGGIDPKKLESFGATWAEGWKSIFDTFTGGTAKATDAVDGLMTVALAATYASQNVAENLGAAGGWLSDVWDWLNTPVSEMGKKKVASEGDAPGPMELANRAMELGRFEAEAARAMEEDAHIERDPVTGELKRVVTGKKGGKSVAGGSSASPATEPAKQTSLLKEIVDNTRPLRDIRDLIVGGGAVTGASFNSVNLSRWTGSGGGGGLAGRIGAALAPIIVGEVNGMLGGMARQRHLNPGGI